MDTKGKSMVSFLLYSTLAAGTVVLCLSTISNRAVALSLFFVFVLLSLIQNQRYRMLATSWRWARLFTFLRFGLALAIQYFDRSSLSGFTVMIVIASVLVSEKVPFCIAFTILAISSTIGMHYWQIHFFEDYPTQTIGTLLFPRIFMVVTLAIARYNIVISEKNRHLSQLLRQKTDELEISMQQLKEYANNLKETAELRAKDQLMRNLHDTLGHTLATASISAQAVTVLMDADISAAQARMGTVTQQIQMAMKSLRDVLSGKSNDLLEDELTSVQFIHLIEETEKSAEITIRLCWFEAEAYDTLPVSQRSFLYNALMEGLTNGLRHGGATSFEVSLQKTDGVVEFTLNDNGCGFGKLNFGYGLSKISWDARCMGGQMHIENRNGCEMRIQLPAGVAEKSEDIIRE
ncbi:MAG: hypothetical protein GXY67_05945 [Clostridiales bacterium]|nr:hypothetical protein [Clostridiales bacterium]